MNISADLPVAHGHRKAVTLTVSGAKDGEFVLSAHRVGIDHVEAAYVSPSAGITAAIDADGRLTIKPRTRSPKVDLSDETVAVLVVGF